MFNESGNALPLVVASIYYKCSGLAINLESPNILIKWLCIAEINF